MKRDEELKEIRRIAETFPARMKSAMKEKSLSVYRLSYETGIHESTIRAYLSGSRMPKVPQLAILTRVLDESADYLLGIYDVSNPVRDVVSPSHEEEVAMTAIAVENDNKTVPTFASIARFAGISKQRTARIVRRLAMAGWVKIDQERRYMPGGLTVTQRYHDWVEKKDDERSSSTTTDGDGKTKPGQLPGRPPSNDPAQP